MENGRRGATTYRGTKIMACFVGIVRPSMRSVPANAILFPARVENYEKEKDELK